MSAEAGPSSIGVGRPATVVAPHWLSERINAASLLVLMFWPYSLAGRELTVGTLLIVSAVALVNRPLLVPRLSALLLAFVLYFTLVLGLQALGGSIGRYAVSQSNHLIQFAIYYFALSKIVQGCDWVRIITSTPFLAAAALLSALYYWAPQPPGAAGNDSDLTITLLALLLGLFIRGKSRRPLTYFLITLGIAAAIIVTSGRSSVLLLMALILLMYWLPLPKLAINIAVATIIVLPIAYYLMIDTHMVQWLYKLDHNTGIRADFVRGAASLLERSPLLGIGFGDPYRPVNFAYATRHQLLDDLGATLIVSNHHSLFDVALRLGIPASLVFWWGLFHAPFASSDARILPILSVVAAVGLSFNAWLENQYMLPQLTLVIVLMHADARWPDVVRGTTPIEARQ